MPNEVQEHIRRVLRQLKTINSRELELEAQPKKVQESDIEPSMRPGQEFRGA